MNVALEMMNDGAFKAYKVTDESREFIGSYLGNTIPDVKAQIEDDFSEIVEIVSLPFQGWV